MTDGGSKAAGQISHFAFRRGALALALLASALTPVVRGADPASQPSRVEAWLVNTRDARGDSQQISFERRDDARGWIPASREEFLAPADRDVPTCYFVHGNRASASAARSMGVELAERLFGAAAAERTRFVIWSWPSDRIPGSNLKDVRAKAARSDHESNLLAEILAAAQPRRLSLIGYSYGARIITGAVHDWAGQEKPESAAPRNIQVVLLAAAEDCDWLLPGHRHGDALPRIDRLLLLRNSCDPVLRWYHLLCRGQTNDALGYTGLPCSAALAPLRERIVQRDVCDCVGRNHELDCYLGSEGVVSLIRPYAIPAAKTPAAGRQP